MGKRGNSMFVFLIFFSLFITNFSLLCKFKLLNNLEDEISIILYETLNVFIIILVCCIFTIIIFLFIMKYKEKQKNKFILKALGYSKTHIYYLFYAEILLILIIAFIFNVLIFIPILIIFPL